MQPTIHTHVMRKVADLRPFAKNPRSHPETQLAKLRANIVSFGFTVPLLIDEDDRVIAGYGRMAAARDLKMVELPCIVVPGLTDARKQALMISDNRISLESAWDSDLLMESLGEITEAGLDASLTGFDAFEVEAMLFPPPFEMDQPTKSSVITVSVASIMDIPSVAEIIRTALHKAGCKGVKVKEPHA